MSIYTELDSASKPITLLLKGDSGSGKTFKAAQFPRPAFFDFDNNLSGLRKLPAEQRKLIRIIDPRVDAKSGKEVKGLDVWANFVAQLEIVGADPEIGTIVIDSLTTMSEVLMDKILKSDDPAKRVEIQEWGDMMRYMKWLGETLLCAKDLDKHVIFLAHEQLVVVNKATNLSKYLLAIGGSMKSNFDLFFTDCWRSYTKANAAGGVDYWIRSLPTDYHSAKTSLVVPPDFKWDDQKESIFKQLQEGLKNDKTN